MLFFGMDTSTNFGSVALVEAGTIRAEYALNLPRTHAERLLPAVHSLLKETGATLQQVDGWAVTTGPGSFTGLRIGLATAKALALTTGKPLVGVPTLDVLVENVPCGAGLICAILNARRGELYTACYRKDRQGHTTRLSGYQALSPEALVASIHEPVFFIGDGALVYGERLRQACTQGVTIAPVECHYPRASVLCRMALERYARDGGTHPRELKALYVRASDAELNRRVSGPGR